MGMIDMDYVEWVKAERRMLERNHHDSARDFWERCFLLHSQDWEATPEGTARAADLSLMEWRKRFAPKDGA